MTSNSSKHNLLRSLPGIDKILFDNRIQAYFHIFSRDVVTTVAREVVESYREKILREAIDSLTFSSIIESVVEKLEQERDYSFRKVINATGVILHTNLGRSPLSKKAREAVINSAFDYCNLEYRLDEGVRGSRQEHLESLLCQLTGAEAAYVVNNNAGAVMLTLNSLSMGKEVIVSRGHLIEIGGSFRLPGVMAKSGAQMVEVGATNRTHLSDYEEAITPATALLFFTHWSNFAMVGFVENPSRKELVDLGDKHDLPVIEDLGSGSLLDLETFGLRHEPTPQESLEAGVSVVTFSGDKLLGGPQAGIILGKKEFLDKIRKNPMARALRIDKMTIPALEATLKHYLSENEPIDNIPILRMMTLSKADIEARAVEFYEKLKLIPGLTVRLMDGFSEVGGGAMPLQKLPTRLIALQVNHETTETTALRMRQHSPSIVARISKDMILIDLRTVSSQEDENKIIKFFQKE